MTIPQISPGATVSAQSVDVDMVVIKVDPNGSAAICSWREGTHTISASFSMTELTLILSAPAPVVESP